MSEQTMIEKILATHSGKPVKPGDIVDVVLDTRAARDFGGANVVGHIDRKGLPLADPSRTFFTFDCNPAGSDQKYAANQQKCRLFAKRSGATVFDVGAGIGTHLAVDQGLAWPGSTFVSTDSHANILGAIGCFGQGMGDVDIAAGFAHGKIWFQVPKSMRVVLKGRPSPEATAKDIALKILTVTGAAGLLGCAAEVTGDYVDQLSLDARMTIASMGTEMGAIALLFAPNAQVMEHCKKATGRDDLEAIVADANAHYEKTLEVDIDGLHPMVSRPGHPEDAIPVAEVRGMHLDSAFLGSCTNGRYEDLACAAKLLEGRKVARGVVLKIVPATDTEWRRALDQGLLSIFKKAGALVSSAGCAGCAEGQVGQNGPGEVTLSTGNRNFPGKQGKGEVWLASPATVVASAIAGVVCTSEDLLNDNIPAANAAKETGEPQVFPAETTERPRPEVITGRAFVVPVDNIDTDMIFHNRHLAITELDKMGPYAFGNLPGYDNLPQWAQPGDVIWTGANFGCGSSRQQAVDAFIALGVGAIIATSYGAIYWRNAVNAGFPVLVCDTPIDELNIKTGEHLHVDLLKGSIELKDSGKTIMMQPMGDVPLEIYRRGGLLRA